jgi:hypothetical protein
MPTDDLFRPTLTADHDTAGIHEQWNPWHLVMITFFFGFVAGAVLIALNAGRLGLDRWVKPALAAGMVFLLANAVILVLVARGAAPATDGVPISPDGASPIAGVVADSIPQGAPPTEADLPDSPSARDRVGLPDRRSTQSRSLRLGRRAVGVLLAILLVIPQLRRYRLAEVHDLPSGKLLVPALIVIVAALVVEFLVLGAAATLFWPRVT